MKCKRKDGSKKTKSSLRNEPQKVMKGKIKFLSFLAVGTFGRRTSPLPTTHKTCTPQAKPSLPTTGSTTFGTSTRSWWGCIAWYCVSLVLVVLLQHSSSPRPLLQYQAQTGNDGRRQPLHSRVERRGICAYAFSSSKTYWPFRVRRAGSWTPTEPKARS